MAIADDSDVSAPGPIVERTDSADEADVPSGLRGPFFQELGKRKRQNRDAKCLVTADHGQTGVGKSNLCDFLGYATDTTEQGFGPEKVTIDPQEFLSLYGTLEPGSASIMEEGEQFDSRRANSHKNVDATQKWQKARVREIVAYVNLPSPATIDKRFEILADYWINVECRGKARIYKKKIHRTKQSIYYETMQTLEWPNMDGSTTFQHMAAAKDEHLNDATSDDSWIRRSEVDNIVDKAVKQERQDYREQWMCSLKDAGLTGKEIADLDVVEVNGSRVNQIARGE